MVYYIYPDRNVWMSKGAKAGPWRAKLPLAPEHFFLNMLLYAALRKNPYLFFGLI
jgi:hypothetical protein